MKNKIVSLVFGSAFILLSFTLLSFQQQVDTGNTNSQNRVIAPCTESITCTNGSSLSCRGKRFCTSDSNSVTCDGRKKVCNADPANPSGN